MTNEAATQMFLYDEKEFLNISVTDIHPPKELPYVIGYPQEDKNLYRLKGVLSRKKQLVPQLMKVFKGV